MQKSHWGFFCLSAVISLTLITCSVFNLPPQISTPTVTTEPYPVAMITFRLALPEPIMPGEKVSLAVIDEITGLAFNQQRYLMQAEDSSHFFVILPFPIGSVVKYRYLLERDYTVQEHTSDGRPVRYRIFHVLGPDIVNDIVSRWTDTNYQLPSGRITGRITDQSDGHPLEDILITAGGAQTISAADGSFVLESLPPGVHNLVAYSISGAYNIFQQGAQVASESATDVQIQLRKAPQVPISFIVTVPDNTPSFVPIRFIGNLIQLGNSFGELRGGLNISARLSPVLTRLPDGRYTITLTLPAGMDLHYKYSLGDGVWNSEQTPQGAFHTRQLIVPEQPMIIEDHVFTWQSGGIAPITLHVTIPNITPPDETISLQLNPGYGWMEPIPMWPAGNNQWIYTLFNPLEGLSSLNYRYCRYDLCGIADEADFSGLITTGRSLTPTTEQQIITDKVERWAWYPSPPTPVTVPSVIIQLRSADFIAGLAFQSSYSPVWGSDYQRGLNDATRLSANWVIVSPTWSVVRTNPPRLEPIPGKDLFASDILHVVHQARSRELNIAIFPQLRFPTSPETWLSKSPRDYSWWISWFETYRRFILHHAELASRSGANALILGGDSATLTLLNGQFLDETGAQLSINTEKFWRELVQEVRSIFNGYLFWSLPYPTGMKKLPPFLELFDKIEILWSARLTDEHSSSENQLYQKAAALLDQDILPLYQQTRKDIYLAVFYPSVDGVTTGCVPNSEEHCLDFSALEQPLHGLIQYHLDLDEQAQAYNALFLALNERPWISGLVSQGYFPFAPLQDFSASVNGKPASGVLWYWFTLLTNP